MAATLDGSAYIYYDASGNRLSDTSPGHEAECDNSNVGNLGSAIYQYIGGGVPLPSYHGDGGFVQNGFGYACGGVTPHVFAVAVTSESVQCYGYTNGHRDTSKDYTVPAQTNQTSPTPYQTCNYFNPSDLGVYQGGIYNFDIYTSGGYFYERINGLVMESGPLTTPSSSGFTGIYIATETTSHQPNMGTLMDYGMYLNSWFVKEYWSTDLSTWTEFPYVAPTPGPTSSMTTMAYPGQTDGLGNDLYCDRPSGSEPFSEGTYYRSGFLDSMNVQATCQ